MNIVDKKIDKASGIRKKSGFKPVMDKVSIFGVNYFVCDYESASNEILEKAIAKKSYGISALAVHGLIECVQNPDFLKLVNNLDITVPDGQPIRWAMNFFHNTGLNDRVSGPQLTLTVLQKANDLGLSIYLYGSTQDTLDKFCSFININYPKLKIVGIHPDRFREATYEEDLQDIEKINKSGANIVLVGRGCPRQEIWVSQHLNKIDCVMMAVGAAFDFCAGTLKKAPLWMQKSGLEWFYRLCMEPRRLWKRYLFTNSIFIYLFIKEALKPKSTNK
jgi:exopolysaccharide biosynthesis WecB/TagA/CpsF family protein